MMLTRALSLCSIIGKLNSWCLNLLIPFHCIVRYNTTVTITEAIRICESGNRGGVRTEEVLFSLSQLRRRLLKVKARYHQKKTLPGSTRCGIQQIRISLCLKFYVQLPWVASFFFCLFWWIFILSLCGNCSLRCHFIALSRVSEKGRPPIKHHIHEKKPASPYKLSILNSSKKYGFWSSKKGESGGGVQLSISNTEKKVTCTDSLFWSNGRAIKSPLSAFYFFFVRHVGIRMLSNKGCLQRKVPTRKTRQNPIFLGRPCRNFPHQQKI